MFSFYPGDVVIFYSSYNYGGVKSLIYLSVQIKFYFISLIAYTYLLDLIYI